MQFIFPDDREAPKGHYSPAVIHGNTIYVSGQLPIDATGQVQSGSIEDQVNLCMRNLENVLMAANSDLRHTLKINIYLTDIELWGRVNTAYQKILGDHRPARAIIPCHELHYGCLLEIDCIATVK